jgi:pilus assembly protein FimV
LKHRTTNATRFALTGVALAAGCLWGAQAWALGLGRLSVQSALGETLRAEIDVTSITPEELSTLKLRIAPAEAYRAAGVEFNAVLTSAQVALQRRPDGRQVLRLTSDRAVLEPFVDVILEANWATGRLVREYTMLFDPPGSRSAQAPAAPPVPQTAPAVSPAPAPVAQAPLPVPVAPAPRAAPAPTPAAAAPAPAAKVASEAGADEVRVRPGDTLSRIAGRTQRPGVSLDQMLVSLYRGNPQAFIGDNMNRLKSGVVLTVPSAEAAAKVGNGEARELIQAQSADFATYRQRLAAGTTATADDAPARQATGKVQANVDDRKQAGAATPDKLTLSQGGVKSPAPEAKVSKDTERKDNSTRLAELSRNVDELKKLQGGAAPAPATPPKAAAPATPPPAPAIAVPVPVTPPPVVVTPPAPPPPAPAPVAAASVPASAPVVAAPVVVAPPVPVAKAVPPPAAEEPGFLASLLENPLVLPGAGVLVALIAGLGVYRLRGRMRKPGGETSFLESRLQPDSFFGASGGQRIDTREPQSSSNSSSSMSYSLSQLDAIGDVDPVAEADVYLAYGRDLQAEEILKEAMRSTPERMAIRLKLLEVYLKRRDTKGFELLATQVFSLTRGSGEDWSKAQELGLQIDPENPLYQPGGAPDLEVGPGGKMIEPLDATTMPHTAKTSLPAFMPAADATLDGTPSNVDLDLDLDLGGDMPAPTAMETTQTLGTTAVPPADDGLEFDLLAPEPPTTAPGALAAAFKPAAPPPDAGSLDFDLGDISIDGTKVTAPPPAAAQGLDFGDFGLDDAGPMTLPPPVEGDPLTRKLELAEEFRQIGDLEGARDLLEEVIAKADGALKSKAQGMLAGLG